MLGARNYLWILSAKLLCDQCLQIAILLFSDSLLHLENPFCCAIILACKEMHAKYMLGTQPWAALVGNKTNFDDNADGIDKFYPHGPSCHYNGCMIPPFVCCSEIEWVNHI